MFRIECNPGRAGFLGDLSTTDISDWIVLCPVGELYSLGSLVVSLPSSHSVPVPSHDNQKMSPEMAKCPSGRGSKIAPVPVNIS